MVKQKPGHLVQSWQRRERGTAVPLSIQRIKLRDGTSAEAHGIDLSQAEVPDKSYFGEICGAEYASDVVRIMFAQPKLGGSGLRSLVIISMPPRSARYFAESLEKMNAPSLKEIVDLMHIAEKSLSEFPAEEPEQTASLTANIVAVAVHGHECCLDFYHANAFAHLAAQKSSSNQLTLDPIVRVNTSSALLMSLLHRLNALIATFPAIDKADEELANAD